MSDDAPGSGAGPSDGAGAGGVGDGRAQRRADPPVDDHADVTAAPLGAPALQHLLDVAADPLLGLERYAVVDSAAPLGEGGMGTVYLAVDRALGREVALKVLRDADPHGELAGRLEREARVLARLEHPGIVPVHDVGCLADGRPFYVMKRVRGRRFDAAARQRPLAEMLRAFEQLCVAVAFAHARGVLHRDLKPANIMLGDFGEVLVMDWGVAKVRAEVAGDGTTSTGGEVAGEAIASAAEAAGPALPATAHGSVLGTPGFMAPEQQRGESVDERADVYALGAILRFLLDLAPPGSRAPALAAICARATDPDPARRYPSAAALADEVDRFLTERRVLAYRESPLARLGRWLVRYRVAIVLVATYLAVRVLLLVLLGG